MTNCFEQPLQATGCPWKSVFSRAINSDLVPETRMPQRSYSSWSFLTVTFSRSGFNATMLTTGTTLTSDFSTRTGLCSCRRMTLSRDARSSELFSVDGCGVRGPTWRLHRLVPVSSGDHRSPCSRNPAPCGTPAPRSCRRSRPGRH